MLSYRFEIEQKLRKAKKEQKHKLKLSSDTAVPTRSVSERSKERRKNMEDSRKDNKKMSALQDLKARREEKRNKGTPVTLSAYRIRHIKPPTPNRSPLANFKSSL